MTRLLSICCLLVCPLLAAGQTRELIQAGKQATALIELEGVKGSATAFCIHESGVFVTNQHVVAKNPAGALVKLILDPNLKTQREVRAKLLRSDAASDLAVLKVDSPGKFVQLLLGDDSDLVETQEISAFGFPFGKSLAASDTGFPDISVNVGRITALRMREGKLNQIQLDAQLNPGNSGGPVIDRDGKVIGIASAGVFATGVNFAVPVSALKRLMEKPEVIFTPPKITLANQHEEADFRVQVVPFLAEVKNLAIELELSVAGAATKNIRFTEVGGEYVAKAIPYPKPMNQPPVRIGVKLTFPSGSVSGEIVDREIRVGDMKVLLSDLRSLDRSKDNQVVRQDGTSITGSAIDLQELDIDLGGSTVRVEFDKARQVAFQPERPSIPSVNYTLVVKNGTTVLYRSSGQLIRGTDGKNAGATDAGFNPYKGQKQVLTLPGTIGDVCLAKGGSLILLHLPKLRKIAVYDVNSASIAHYIQVGADEILMAGGLEKLIIVSPSINLIERWSLNTFERETSKTLPGGIVKNIALGYASPGPLLVLDAASTEALARCTYKFYDLNTLDALDLGQVRGRNSSYRDAVHIRAAGTGDVFGLWATSHSPQGMETMILSGNQVKVAHQHSSAGHIAPNFDGTSILTATAGVCSPDLNTRAQKTQGLLPAIPSTHARFYVTVPAEPGAQINLGSDPFKGRSGAVRLVDGTADLVQLPDLELGTNAGGTSWARHDFTIDKRVHFIPQADQLVSIPYSNDKLVVQRFNLRESLDAAKVDFLYVSSTAPTWFTRGEAFRYQVHVECNTPGATVELATGPGSMAVGAAGEVVWAVPPDFNESEVQCVLNIKGADGRTTFHSFKIKEKQNR